MEEMVDTYSGIVPHGGGALSDKDGTKADRSGAYMACYIAKNIDANGHDGSIHRCVCGGRSFVEYANPLQTRW